MGSQVSKRGEPLLLREQMTFLLWNLLRSTDCRPSSLFVVVLANGGPFYSPLAATSYERAMVREVDIDANRY
jgi:hypothetical protein